MQTPATEPDDVRETDRALVAAVLAGMPGAFEQLVTAHQGLCWHVIDRMVRNPDDTRELCQDTFLRVHQALHQFRGDSPLKSWIAQVAYSIARRHLERKRIPLAEPPDGDGMALADTVADRVDVVDTVSRDEAAGRLHAAMDRLPPLQRTLLTLYHLDELPIAEIAGITGLPEGTIKSHLHRSRRQLRALLAPSPGVFAA